MTIFRHYAPMKLVLQHACSNEATILSSKVTHLKRIWISVFTHLDREKLGQPQKLINHPINQSPLVKEERHLCRFTTDIDAAF